MAFHSQMCKPVFQGKVNNVESMNKILFKQESSVCFDAGFAGAASSVKCLQCGSVRYSDTWRFFILSVSLVLNLMVFLAVPKFQINKCLSLFKWQIAGNLSWNEHWWMQCNSNEPQKKHQHCLGSTADLLHWSQRGKECLCLFSYLFAVSDDFYYNYCPKGINSFIKIQFTHLEFPLLEKVYLVPYVCYWYLTCQVDLHKTLAIGSVMQLECSVISLIRVWMHFWRQCCTGSVVRILNLHNIVEFVWFKTIIINC